MHLVTNHLHKIGHKAVQSETDAEKQQAEIMKERIFEYNQKTPVPLSKTMFHPIHTIWFSTSSGKVGKKERTENYHHLSGRDRRACVV